MTRDILFIWWFRLLSLVPTGNLWCTKWAQVLGKCPSVSPATYCFYPSILKSPYYVWAQITTGPSFTANSQAPGAHEIGAAITEARSWKLTGSPGWRCVNFSLAHRQACPALFQGLLQLGKHEISTSTFPEKPESHKGSTGGGRQIANFSNSTLTITDFSFRNWLCQGGWEPSCGL